MTDLSGDSFLMMHDRLRETPEFASIIDAFDVRTLIDSQASFNAYCREWCRVWKLYFPEGRGGETTEFLKLCKTIAGGVVENEIIQTPWGGVVVTRYQHPDVEKFLVIHQGGYLAMEKHAQKDEQLEIREGRGVLLWREGDKQTLSVQELCPGDTYHFKPGSEHCIIGTENLLVFERSVDPLGMDQDLIFIYTPE